MLKDISVSMYVTIPDKSRTTINDEISYVLNEACSKIEGLSCQVFYKLKDSRNKEIQLELPPLNAKRSLFNQ